jgi:hypothetical protein
MRDNRCRAAACVRTRSRRFGGLRRAKGGGAVTFADGRANASLPEALSQTEFCYANSDNEDVWQLVFHTSSMSPESLGPAGKSAKALAMPAIGGALADYVLLINRCIARQP